MYLEIFTEVREFEEKNGFFWSIIVIIKGYSVIRFTCQRPFLDQNALLRFAFLCYANVYTKQISLKKNKRRGLQKVPLFSIELNHIAK